MKKTRLVQTVICWEDHYWDELYLDVPYEYDTEPFAQSWLEDNTFLTTEFRKMIFGFVVDADPELPPG